MALGQHLRCLQLASQTTDMEQRRLLLTVAVIGAGQVVEMAATLADLLPSWYEKLHAQIRVILNRSKEISRAMSIVTRNCSKGIATTYSARRDAARGICSAIRQVKLSTSITISWRRPAATIIWTNTVHPPLKICQYPKKIAIARSGSG